MLVTAMVLHCNLFFLWLYMFLLKKTHWLARNLWKVSMAPVQKPVGIGVWAKIRMYDSYIKVCLPTGFQSPQAGNLQPCIISDISFSFKLGGMGLIHYGLTQGEGSTWIPWQTFLLSCALDWSLTELFHLISYWCDLSGWYIRPCSPIACPPSSVSYKWLLCLWFNVCVPLPSIAFWFCL